MDDDLLEKSAITILREKSKDIRILLFLSFSYLKQEKWELFADIYEGLGIMIEQNYDALYPDRDRGKQLAFKWIAEKRFTLLLEEKKPSEQEYEHIVRIVGGLTKIKPVLEQKFPDGSPFPSDLFKYAQQWERTSKPKPKVETPPPPPVTPPGKDTASLPEGGPTTPLPPPPPPTDGQIADSKQAQVLARKAALFLIEKERNKVIGYRIIRSLRWDIIDKTPPAEGGKIKLEGPNPQQRAYFQKLVADKEWRTLLEKAEAAFISGGNHLWLDLQRFIATACKELGAEYTLVRDTVIMETALLLKRIPDISELLFADGSTCCDDATKDWIATEVLSLLQSGDGLKAAGFAADPLAEEHREVNKLVAAGQIEDALVLLQNAIHSSSCERDNFRRMIMISSLLLKAKQPDIAISILETLDRKIDQHALEAWDPKIAVEAWVALATSYKVGKVQKPQNVQAQIQDRLIETLGKIGRIDPGKAFSLSK